MGGGFTSWVSRRLRPRQDAQMPIYRGVILRFVAKCDQVWEERMHQSSNVQEQKKSLREESMSYNDNERIEEKDTSNEAGDRIADLMQ